MHAFEARLQADALGQERLLLNLSDCFADGSQKRRVLSLFST